MGRNLPTPTIPGGIIDPDANPPANAWECTPRQLGKQYGCTVRMAIFAKEHVRSFGNASLAAELAGYKANGKTLEAIGRENLAKNSITMLIDRFTRDFAVNITPEDVLHSLSLTKELARNDGKYGDAVAADKLIGQAKGMWQTTQAIDLGDELSFQVIRRRPIDATDPHIIDGELVDTGDTEADVSHGEHSASPHFPDDGKV